MTILPDDRPFMAKMLRHAPEFAPEVIEARYQKLRTKGYRGMELIRRVIQWKNRVSGCYGIAASLARETDPSLAWARADRRAWRRMMADRHGPINFRWLLAETRTQIRLFKEGEDYEDHA